MSFLSNLFSNSNNNKKEHNNSEILKEVEQRLVKMGQIYTGFDLSKTPNLDGLMNTDTIMQIWKAAAYGRESYYSLSNRNENQRRFVIVVDSNGGLMHIWNGTLLTLGPPINHEDDSNSFFKKDVRQHASIGVGFPHPKAQRQVFTLTIFDNGLKLINKSFEIYEIQSSKELLDKLKQIQGSIEAL